MKNIPDPRTVIGHRDIDLQSSWKKTGTHHSNNNKGPINSNSQISEKEKRKFQHHIFEENNSARAKRI